MSCCETTQRLSAALRPRSTVRRISRGAVALLMTTTACQAGGDSARGQGAGVIGTVVVDHVVPSTPENVSWGWFPFDKDPVIRVRPGDRTTRIGDLDLAVWSSGVRVPLAPFMGIYAVAPDTSVDRFGVDVPGVRRSGPPGRFGGNLDVKHLSAGTSVFLPVFHPGARFFVGDPHGAQGDGEVSGTAIEQSMTGTFRFVVHKGAAPAQPRGETPSHHLIMGLDLDLNRALRNATYEVVSFLVARYGLRPAEAFSVASTAVDFTISEAVDRVQVVTGMVPKAIFPDSMGSRR